MNRRCFFYICSILILNKGFKSFSFPINKYLGDNPDKTYLKIYFKKMYDWHCKNYYNFENKWTANEKKLIELWLNTLSTWGLKIGEDHLYENFNFSHSVASSALDSSNIMIALDAWEDKVFAKVQEVLNEKRIQLSDQEKANFRGLAWNMNKKTITILSLTQKADFNSNLSDEINSNLLKVENSNWHFPILQKRIINLETFKTSFEWNIPLKKVTRATFPSNTSLDITSVIQVVSSKSKKFEYIYRLRSLSPEVVHKNIHNIIKEMSDQFSIHPDYIRYIDNSNFRIYYP